MRGNNSTPKIPSILELENVLREEINLYERYAAFLAKDSQLMGELKIEELENSNKSKATLLLKIQALDEVRQKIVTRIATEQNISEASVKIVDICKTLTPQNGQALLDLRDRLHVVINQIKILQTQTAAVVQGSMSWIDGAMATLKRLLTPTGTYNAKGRVDHPESFTGRVLESKA